MSGIVVTVTAVLAIVLTVAGAAGVWLAMRTAQNSQTLKNFRDASASWREKADALTDELVAVRADLVALTSKYATLLAAHEVLKDVVTGQSALEELTERMGEYKDDIIKEIRVAAGRGTS